MDNACWQLYQSTASQQFSTRWTSCLETSSTKIQNPKNRSNPLFCDNDLCVNISKGLIKKKVYYCGKKTFGTNGK